MAAAMMLAAPYPAALVWVARKVVWYDRPEETLAYLPTFLAHLMVYGSSADVTVVEQYVPEEEFRKVLEKRKGRGVYAGGLGKVASSVRNAGAATTTAPISRWLAWSGSRLSFLGDRAGARDLSFGPLAAKPRRRINLLARSIDPVRRGVVDQVTGQVMGRIDSARTNRIHPHPLATFRRKNDGLNRFDPEGAAPERCMIVQFPTPKQF